MAYKQKGFPMHSTKSALKQTTEADDKEEEYIEESYHSGGGFNIPYKDPLNNPEAIKAQQDRIDKAIAQGAKVVKNEDGTYTEIGPRGSTKEIDFAGRIISKSSDMEKVEFNTDGTIKSRKVRSRDDGSWIDVT